MRFIKIKLAFAFLVLLLLGVNFISAEDLTFNSSDDNYVVEYQKSSLESGNAYILNCVFTKPISAGKAEDFLNGQIKLALKFQQPSSDLTAYAWLHTNDGESLIPLTDGSDFLIFNPKANKIFTEKAYSIAMAPRPDSNKVINISFDVSLVRTSGGKVKVLSKTDLPDQMLLTVSLRNQVSGYSAQDNVSVLNGNLESSGFDNSGVSLPAGQYDVSIYSPLPDLQPASIKEIIGKNGENLTGAFVNSWMGGNMVKFEKKLELN
jgi:hypothetical protein